MGAPRDPVTLRGEARYQHLVALCRELGVITPEDPYPVWTGAGGPAVIVPLFLLYDYTFRPDGASTKAEALDLAYQTGVIGADERHLHPDPYPSREAWCQARIDATLPRLAAIDPELPTILVSHFPLTREPTRILRYPVFSQWCGTEQTGDGTAGSAPAPWSTATCTSRGPCSRTACGSRRCPSATPTSRTGTRSARAS